MVSDDLLLCRNKFFPCVYFMGKAARNLTVRWRRPLINKGIMQLETV
ncbi:hypothetical protein NEISICOT_01771 [Neisseria sicca ATCC 29256]|uniref:Uncharacterized protein n=1 Tax=Neisseria sicca ATCC 29256 TaxID=547045 RepID=C6M5H2_NEISI|nr:hypothetical protein NEISICOT_01771 [Neisseria sicca ATCC 29256]